MTPQRCQRFVIKMDLSIVPTKNSFTLRGIRCLQLVIEHLGGFFLERLFECIESPFFVVFFVTNPHLYRSTTPLFITRLKR